MSNNTREDNDDQQLNDSELRELYGAYLAGDVKFIDDDEDDQGGDSDAAAIGEMSATYESHIANEITNLSAVNANEISVPFHDIYEIDLNDRQPSAGHQHTTHHYIPFDSGPPVNMPTVDSDALSFESGSSTSVGESDLSTAAVIVPGPRSSSLQNEAFLGTLAMSESSVSITDATNLSDIISASTQHSASNEFTTRSSRTESGYLYEAAQRGPLVLLRRSRLPWDDSSDDDDEDGVEGNSESDDQRTLASFSSTAPSVSIADDGANKRTGKRADSPPRSRRRCLVIVLSVFAAVLLAGGAVITGLYFSGTLAKLFRGQPAVPVRGQLTQSVLSAAPGSFGCSNRPIRAPLISQDFWESTSSNDGGSRRPSELKCPSGTVRYTLTECNMLATMQPLPAPTSQQSYLNSTLRPYLQPLLQAMEAYDINCSPKRITAFLSTIRHETNGLLRMYQPIDGGAGAVHLLPSYFHLAVSGIPQLNQAYQREFSKRYPLSQLQSVVQTDPAFREQIGQLLSRQEYTFLVAGWWMTDGAQQTMGTQLGCGDLRVDMDRGLGETDSTAKNSGFYRVTECVYGTISDPGLAQRLQYYQSISDYASTSMKCQTTQCYQ